MADARILVLCGVAFSAACGSGHDAPPNPDAAADSSGAAGGEAGGAAGIAPSGGGGGIGGIQTSPARGGAAGMVAANVGGSLQDEDAGTNGDAAASGGASGSSSLWRPFNDQSPWNKPIANSAPIDASSAALIDDLSKSMGASTYLWVNIAQYSIPVYWADAATPNRTVTATVLGGEGFGTGSSRDNVTATVPIPDGAAAAQGTDAHLCIVDKQRDSSWGFWSMTIAGSTYRCQVGASIDLAGTGVHPPITDTPWWMAPDARACGFPLIAGLLTVEEVRAGQIRHALVLAYPHIRSRYFTYPASTAQGTTTDALPDRGIPCGGHVQLDPSLNVDALGLSASGRAIARALQVYGAFVGDYSGSISLYADSSPAAQASWRDGLLASDEVLTKIALTSFRLLQMGALLDNDN